MNLSTQPGRSGASQAQQSRWLLAAAGLASLVLWYVPGAGLVLYPIRLFVTLIHEGSHALVTVLTGGSVVHIVVRQDTSGVTLSQGGLYPLIVMAGYVGATAFGAGCLQLARTARAGRRGLVFLASVVLLVTGMWINPLGQGWFGFASGVGIGVALITAARYVSDRAAAFLVSFLAVELCLNALFDMRTLLWLTTNTSVPNDAVFMAQYSGVPPWFWAGLWSIFSLLILAASLRAYWKGVRASG